METTVGILGHTPIWQGRGIPINGRDIEAALRLTKLNFNVKFAPQQSVKMITPTNGEPDRILENHISRMTYREDNGIVLGDVGMDYTILQNEEAFGFVGDILTHENGQDAMISYGNQFLNGAKVWLDIDLNDPIKVGPHDILTRLILTWAHDGSRSWAAEYVAINSVTRAILKAPMHGFRDILKVRHTRNVRSRVAEAGIVLAGARRYFEQAEAQFETLAITHMSDGEIGEFLKLILPEGSSERGETKQKNKRRAIEAFVDSEELKPFSNSAFGLWNAVASFETHSATTRKCRFDTDQEARLHTQLFGANGGSLTRKSFTALMERVV